MKHMIKKAKILTFLVIFSIVNITMVSNVFAASYYAGTYKSGSNKGIAAKIKTPASLPKLGSSGESCWVTNAYGSPIRAISIY